MNTYTPEIQAVLAAARDAGVEAEVYLRASTATTIRIQDQEVDQFSLADSRGAGIRVVKDGKVGYAFTEDLSGDALLRTLEAAITNAGLIPEGKGATLASFAGETVELGLHRPELAAVAVPLKIEKAKALERIAKESDPRIKNVTSTAYTDTHGFVRIASTAGVDRSYQSSIAMMATVPLLHADGQNKNYYQIKAVRDFDALDPEAIAREGVARAAEKLGAFEPQSGAYPVLIDSDPMGDLLQVFAGVFSGKLAQEGKTLLKDKVGEAIASAAITIVDDPLNVEGYGARPFDDEGCPSQVVTLVEAGVFKGFLHNAETARQAGVASTGHAARAGYRGTVEVAPSNLYLAPGARTPEAILAEFDRAVIVTEVTGLHAGANPISGDFSLQAQGFLWEGQKRSPIHNFTISGNFYALLSGVSEVASDLEWFTSGIGSPSVLVKELAIAGA
ncbi:TldD/PmbA family protein [bacterium]|nr:TldD/PmbA family protein [bacterium]